jgi:hypothetical protein
MIRELVESPNSRAKCRRCRKTIAQGEGRATSYDPSPFAGADEVRSYLHALCAVDVDAAGVAKVLARSSGDFTGRAAVEALVAARVKAIDAANDPAAARVTHVAAVAPAADPTGRPRVRVFLAGSAFSLGNGPAFEFDIVAKLRAWRSPLREYQFVVQYTGEPDPPEDPSQPVIGAVFAPFADGKAMSNQRHKVSGWRARSLPTPILWIFARGTSLLPSDDEVLRWREFLESAGYNGDEAAVCLARKVDAAALDALVAALDESLGAVPAPKDVAVVTDLALAEQLATLIAQERAEAANDALLTALAVLRASKKTGVVPEFQRAHVGGITRVTPDGRAALTRVAVAALALDECLDSALAVLESGPEVDASAAVRKAIERFVSDPKRKLTKSFDHLIEFAKKRAVPDRATALMAALEASKTPARARSLAESIVAAGATPIDARFLAWVDALDKSDKRRAELSAARTAVRRRAPKG